MSEQYKKELKDLFDLADTSGDGTLSIQELIKILRSVGNKDSDSKIAGDFAQDDVNNDSKISFEEFWECTKKRDPKTVKDEELRHVFQQYDKDGSGFITASELKEALKGRFSQATIDRMLTDGDTDKDDKINCEEFIASWKD